MNPVELLHRVAHDAAEERRKLTEKQLEATTWSFSKGINLLINPEVKCPGCKKWWPTNRMWLVNENEQQMERVWTLAGERVSLYKAHPHVSSDDGSICVGDFSTASQALVMGLNRDSYYNSVATYLRSLGDDCQYANEEFCEDCENFIPISEMYQKYDSGWVCDSCDPQEEAEKPRYCKECEAELTEEQQSYCDNCCCEECVALKHEQEEDF